MHDMIFFKNWFWLSSGFTYIETSNQMCNKLLPKTIAKFVLQAPAMRSTKALTTGSHNHKCHNCRAKTHPLNFITRARSSKRKLLFVSLLPFSTNFLIEMRSWQFSGDWILPIAHKTSLRGTPKIVQTSPGSNTWVLDHPGSSPKTPAKKRGTRTLLYFLIRVPGLLVFASWNFSPYLLFDICELVEGSHIEEEEKTGEPRG